MKTLVFFLGAVLTADTVLHAEAIKIEGENPTINNMHRHPWWYDKVKRESLSGGDFISNFDKDKPGEAEYAFTAQKAGDYEFWLHANPVKSHLTYALNGATPVAVDFNGEKRDLINIAADDKPDLRFIAWIKVGKVPLRAGANTIRFNTAGPQENHGIIDCFVFSREPYDPSHGSSPASAAADTKDWFAFDPKSDTFAADSVIDLRSLNEKFAGEHGFIRVKDGQFSCGGKPVRFWAVNGPPPDLKGDALRRCARLLAKYGINLVRVHGGMFDKDGIVDPAKIEHAREIVAAMKAEGIYTHFSIYFPLWLTPKPGTSWLPGYDGKHHPFSALFFNPDFQAQYRQWWTPLITAIRDDPAVFGFEMQNEDSFFFWTFDEKNIPDPELRLVEKMFGDWLRRKYGSLDTAFAKWGGQKAKRDVPDEGRVAFRPLWNMFNEKTPRDQDTVAFLLETQTKFYSDTAACLRKLGFKGLITASNWATASPEFLGPLEKLTYAASGDFIDRHGYFSCNHTGDNAAWSIRNGHTYADRSAYRFEAETPGKPRQFVHPAMDVHYNNKPSMISEIAWCRPNRFRSEAPLYLAAYGALQNSDAIVQFALDSDHWAVKPGFFMQPWTMTTPATMGQFPAAALIYRRSLVTPGAVLAEINLNQDDLVHLKGTPLPQDAALDELRLADVPQGVEVKPGQRLDPLLHYAGRAEVRFTTTPGSVKVADLRPLINHTAQTVISSTRELTLDYGKGFLVINAPRAQGVSGQLKTAGPVRTKDLTITSDMEIGHIIAVSLDNQPLATSGRILLQIMSEEKATGFRTEPAAATIKRITDMGRDPWQVKELSGIVRFNRPLKITALDFNGYPIGPAVATAELKLQATTMYYLVGQ